MLNEIKADIIARLTEYINATDEKGVNEKLLAIQVENAIREIKDKRNYPLSYTDDVIEADLSRFKQNIYNLALYDYAQIGMPFETSHSEPNSSRTYTSRDKLFQGVLPLSRVIGKGAIKKPLKNAYTSLKRIKEYLYEVEYEALDYEYAYKHFEKTEDYRVSGCSVVRKSNLFGRNYDWTYNENAEFIVRTPHTPSRYATIGIAGNIDTLTNEFVDSGDYSELYNLVPFMIVDGINECGLVANMNVVPLDKGKNKAIPQEVSEVRLNALMLVRYVLDYFSSATQTVEYIQKHTTIYFSRALHDLGYELHFVIADKDKTYCVEFINNQAIVIDITEKPYVTNFYLDGVEFNSDGKVYTPSTQTDSENAFDTNHITLYGSGLERFNLIVDTYSSLDDKSSMRGLLKDLYFTNAYSSDNEWLTEFVGGDLTVKSLSDDFTETKTKAEEAYKKRDRKNPITWQTTHSSIYDIDNLELLVVVQEDNEELNFKL